MSDRPSELYEQAREKIRRYEPGSLVGHAVNALHESHAAGVDGMRTLRPWEILLAIQWTVQEADGNFFLRMPALRNDLHVLLNILHEIEAAVPMPDDYQHWMLFMRQLAFQQFALQHGPDGSSVARQLILFGSLQPNHRLQVAFMKETGVSIQEFCILCFGLLTLALQTPAPRAINPLDLKKLESSGEPGSVDKLFRFLGKTIPELHTWLAADKYRSIPIADQRILPSPLLDVPLLANAPNQYFIYHPSLFIRSLETVVYRTLRRTNPEKFGDHFGPMFEHYVARCMDCAGLEYLDEGALKAVLMGTGKCVDFSIVESNCNVLIDAKAVEMPPWGRVSDNAEFLMRAIKSSVNAMRQGLETRRRIDLLPPESRSKFGTGETFLVIVTFDDLYLGTNKNFQSIFGGTLLPRLEQDYGSQLAIPFENMFFLSISELESLLEMIRIGKTTFVSALRHARQQDGDRATQKLQFIQHLDSLGLAPTRLPLVTEALEDIAQKCTHRVATA